MTPTPRAAIVLAGLALLALVLPTALIGVLALALVLVSAYDAWLVRGQPQLRREMPAVVSRGVPAAVSLKTDHGRARRIIVHQSAPPGLSLVPAQAAGSLHAQLTASVRGRHRVPAAGMRSEGPLGLGASYTRDPAETEVHVYPDLVTARRLALAARRGGLTDSRTRARGALGMGTEFESVREWSPDDDIRHVNWRATQRLGRPMTNQYRLEQSRELVCLVDTGRLMSAPIGDRNRLDLALDAVAAVALVADQLGDNCGAVAFDSEIRRELRPRRAGAHDLIAALFDIQPRPVDTDYERAFRRITGGKRSLVLLLCDLFDDEAARALVDAVPVLVRRHAVVIGSISDPDLDAPLVRAPSEPIEVFTAAAAAELVQARDRAQARLRGAGASVVQAPPHRFPAACVQAYLSAKRRLAL